MKDEPSPGSPGEGSSSHAGNGDRPPDCGATIGIDAGGAAGGIPAGGPGDGGREEGDAGADDPAGQRGDPIVVAEVVAHRQLAGIRMAD
jgi:hypothetical protein